ncbi:hypothetical protein SLEP1_g37167 [Rubroshorea leprosula]|uniref:Uncharacterized protein n=1 Tax=Rubroshorea leprosula TaxID=152421 RepID=A0AAV5KTQ2_9ROSI|nr:hypothetical protein SLEP1_g37167 [Rubroshorea leprosula]
MRRPGKKRSSPEQPKLCISENPEQPESSRSKRVGKSKQLGSGKKKVDVQGKNKVKASYPQRNKGGGKRQAGIKAVNNDRKIQLEVSKLRREVLELRRQYGDLEKANEDLAKENEGLNSNVTAMEELIEQVEGQKNFMENSPMHVDSPKGKIDALVPLTCPKEGLATIKLITQGTGPSEAEVLRAEIKQIWVKLREIRANNKQLKGDKERLNSKLKIEIKIPCNEELAANNHVIGGERTNPHVTSTGCPTSSTSSSGFMSHIHSLLGQVGTALVDQLALALVEQLVLALFKHMEDFVASFTAQETEREFKAVDAKEDAPT